MEHEFKAFSFNKKTDINKMDIFVRSDIALPVSLNFLEI